MKKTVLFAVAGFLTAGILLMTGCEGDWTSGESGYNTSKGAGVQINFSGMYKGTMAGGKAVANTSGMQPTHFVISQSGNKVEVMDSFGSKYSGNVGSPGTVSDPAGGTFSAGAELLQGQINFSGHDDSANKHVDFVGVIHAVAVTDIKGAKTSTGQTDDRTRTQNSTSTTNVTINSVGTNTLTVTTIILYDAWGNVLYQQVTTVTTTPSGTEINRTVEVTDNRTQTDTSEATATTEYSITEANTQYRLQGNWVEEGGVISQVDALSPATAGLITTVSSATATTE